MNATGHYEVIRQRRHETAAGVYWTGDIRFLRCGYCPFTVNVRALRRSRDRSGLPKYNRARALIVRHLHQNHRAELAFDNGPAPIL